jgi:fumagillin biosynthesis monooxygenase
VLTTRTQAGIKNNFKVSTLVLFGAICQIIIFALLPLRWAIVPVLILTIKSVATTSWQLLHPHTNYFMKGVVPGIVSAQLPNRATGRSGPVPADQQVVCLHIGAQYNHPLGYQAPGAAEVQNRFRQLAIDAYRRADDYGLLGTSSWTCAERPTANTGMAIMYFRDVEGLHRFAHDPMHREAWDWWNKMKDEYPHIGIFHETFVSPPGGWETIYHHMRPVLMGATSVRCKTEEGEVWVNPLVSAANTTLRGQYGRMNRRGNEAGMDE